MSQSSAWIAMEKQYYAQTVRRQPVVLVRGQGCRVWDADGKEYLDLVAGWAVHNLGHAYPVVTHAIAEQAATLVRTSNQFYTQPQLLLAQLLIEHSCLDRVFFGNSGAEANERALKLARKYGKQQRDGAYEVIIATNSFHGRTLTRVSRSATPLLRQNPGRSSRSSPSSPRKENAILRWSWNGMARWWPGPARVCTGAGPAMQALQSTPCMSSAVRVA